MPNPDDFEPIEPAPELNPTFVDVEKIDELHGQLLRNLEEDRRRKEDADMEKKKKK